MGSVIIVDSSLEKESRWLFNKHPVIRKFLKEKSQIRINESGVKINIKENELDKSHKFMPCGGNFS